MPASTFEVSGISRRRIMLRVVVLGVAAGGGIPQWNCGCAVCLAARTEHPELGSTQASVAISADGGHWFLINASPDLRQQLIATPQLHPQAGELRHSPVSGVILTNGEIDAITGLLSMREGWPFTIYAHPKVLSILKANSIFNVLNDKNVRRQPIELDKTFEPTLPGGSPAGIEIVPFAVPGKSAWYLEGEAHPAADDGAGDTIGLRVRDKATGKYFYLRAAEQCRGTGSGAPADRGYPLSQSASVPSAIARRQAEQGTGAGLGAEPLLLPEHHSDQGCRGDLALPRPRHPARMAAQTGGS